MILTLKRRKKISKLFHNSPFNHSIINQYEKYLYYKVIHQTISIEYANHLHNTSVNFLTYCKNFKYDKPSFLSLEGYLWIYPSHKYYLTEFTSFLSKKYSFEINIKKVKKAVLQRPKRSHQILKKRLIKILQNPNDPYIKEDEFFRLSIGYLHWIDVPQNVFLNQSLIKKDKNNNFFIHACSTKFFIPRKLKYLISKCNILTINKRSEH